MQRTDASSQSYAFVELKSFGDLVISAGSLRLLPHSELARCRLLIGPYLLDLCRALAPPCAVEVMSIPDRNIPALFDMRNRGVMAGLHSALTLRAALARAAPDTTLVMVENLVRRERFIAGGRARLAIPAADNVYLGFEAFMRQTFDFTSASSALKSDRPRPKRVALCPLSRVPAKNVPPAIVVELARACEQAGFEVELLQLEGESFRHSGAPCVRAIPRRFDALGDALAGYAAVISADSLPAHFAEYRGTPAFVVTPVENRYWLPKRAFQRDYWGLFADHTALTSRLQRFLDCIAA